MALVALAVLTALHLHRHRVWTLVDVELFVHGLSVHGLFVEEQQVVVDVRHVRREVSVAVQTVHPLMSALVANLDDG